MSQNYYYYIIKCNRIYCIVDVVILHRGNWIEKYFFHSVLKWKNLKSFLRKPILICVYI